VIPLVVASERGGAQTRRFAFWGCRASHMELQKTVIDEAVWKGPSEKVTIL
jgi:hypothetical protein